MLGVEAVLKVGVQILLRLVGWAVEFQFLKEDIHRFISSTELFLNDIRGLRYPRLKKVNFLWDTQ